MKKRVSRYFVPSKMFKPHVHRNLEDKPEKMKFPTSIHPLRRVLCRAPRERGKLDRGGIEDYELWTGPCGFIVCELNRFMQTSSVHTGLA
jgi:hypothetical protein